VQTDLESFMSRLVCDGDPAFVHTAEGDDDMPAHIRSVLTQTELTLPVSQSRLLLGAWQGVYLWEHRTSPHHRKITLTIMGQ
jgi:secondary thiamine-phosphate synthase enzyme